MVSVVDLPLVPIWLVLRHQNDISLSLFFYLSLSLSLSRSLALSVDYYWISLFRFFCFVGTWGETKPDYDWEFLICWDILFFSFDSSQLTHNPPNTMALNIGRLFRKPNAWTPQHLEGLNVREHQRQPASAVVKTLQRHPLATCSKTSWA